MDITPVAKAQLDRLLEEAMKVGLFEFTEEHHGEGICLICGAERYSCEPDAEGYECEVCGRKAVMGLETAFITFM